MTDACPEYDNVIWNLSILNARGPSTHLVHSPNANSSLLRMSCPRAFILCLSKSQSSVSFFRSKNKKSPVGPFNASPRSRPVIAFLDFATPVGSSTRAYIRVNSACSIYTLRAPRGNRWPRERNIPSNPGRTFPRKDRARIQTHIPTEDARRRVRV